MSSADGERRGRTRRGPPGAKGAGPRGHSWSIIHVVARATAVALLAAAVAAGCADAPAGPATPTPRPAEQFTRLAADQHAADVAYAQMMMPHVSQGVELTDMVPARTADPALSRLASSMNYVDVEEQGQLAGQLHLWNAPVPGERSVPLEQMAGMADRATLDRLRTLSGAVFDRTWLTVMIAHHRGGLDMSRAYLQIGTGQALAGIAEAQVQVGSRQIDQMRALLSPS